MSRLVAVAFAALLVGSVPSPAEAASYKLGGKCTKALQVRTIKGVRAQCTWVKLVNPTPKQRGKLVWKAIPKLPMTATRAELGQATESPAPTPPQTPAPTPTETPAGAPSVDTPTATPAPTKP